MCEFTYPFPWTTVKVVSTYSLVKIIVAVVMKPKKELRRVYSQASKAAGPHGITYLLLLLLSTGCWRYWRVS